MVAVLPVPGGPCSHAHQVEVLELLGVPSFRMLEISARCCCLSSELCRSMPDKIPA